VKLASAALKALLATRSFAVGDLYTFTLVGGGVLRYTSYDTDIVYNGNTYASGGQGGPFFDRSDNKAKCHWKIGVEVDTLSFDVIPGGATVNGQPFLSAVRQGAFDGAELELDRAFFAPPGQGSYPPVTVQPATGTVVLFVGGSPRSTPGARSRHSTSTAISSCSIRICRATSISRAASTRWGM